MNAKILHIINSSGLGGAESIVAEIIKNRGDFCFCLKKDEVQRFDESNDRIYFGTTSSFYKCNPLVFYRLIKLIRKIHPEILHIHLGISLIYAYFIKLLFPKLKLIYHEHGEIQYNRDLKLFLKFAKNKIDVFIAVSYSINEQLKDCGVSEEKIIILRSFVDFNKFYPQKYNLKKQEQFVIGFAGRIIDIKGWIVLIKATYLVSKKNLPIKLLIAGDGIQKKEMLQMIKKMGIEKNVNYLGYIADVNSFYSLIDCLVVPSYFEASPMSIMEAQAMGVLVLASSIDSVKELILNNTNGVLFERGNVQDLYNKIIYLYNKPELRIKISKEALITVQKYSLDNYLIGLNNIYGNLSI